MNAGLELAYEEHRYHDARRWMIRPQQLPWNKVIKVTASQNRGKIPHVP
jgi:hypothetical protein